MAKVVGPNGVHVELDDFIASSLVSGGHAEYVSGKGPEKKAPPKDDPSGTEGNQDQPSDPEKKAPPRKK